MTKIALSELPQTTICFMMRVNDITLRISQIHIILYFALHFKEPQNDDRIQNLFSFI